MSNAIKTTLLLGLLTGLILGIRQLSGRQPGAGHRLRLCRGDELRRVLVLGQDRAGHVPRPAGRRDASARALPDRPQPGHAQRLPMPRLYLIPTDTPNAFATGRSPQHAAVAVTEGLLRLMRPEELEGVLAHEFGHVKNRDTLISTVAATLAGVIMMLANMLRWAAIFGGIQRDDRDGRRHPWAAGHDHRGAAGGHADPAGHLAQPRVPGRRHRRRISPNPLGLAAALEKLERGSEQVPLPPTRRPRTCSSSTRSAARRCAAVLHPPAAGGARPPAAVDDQW